VTQDDVFPNVQLTSFCIKVMPTQCIAQCVNETCSVREHALHYVSGTPLSLKIKDEWLSNAFPE